MDTVEEIRLAKLLEEIKRRGYGGQAAIGRDIGVSPAQIQQWVKGVRTISSESARRIERAIGKPVGWLDRAIETPSSGGPSNVSEGPNLGRPIPLISWVQAGEWHEACDPYPPGDAEDWIPAPGRFGPHTFALRVRGDSMEPEFKEGDVIIVDPGREAKNGDYVVVRMDQEAEVTFKQLVIEGGRYLKPVNPRYPVIPINGHATIVGVVGAKTKTY